VIFTPSTDAVRAAFVKYTVQHSPSGISAEEAGAAFDDWYLGERDKAMDDAYNAESYAEF
jgi:hypothetical protein